MIAKEANAKLSKCKHICKHKCLLCSKVFKSKRTDAKYCSNACRQRAHRNNKESIE